MIRALIVAAVAAVVLLILTRGGAGSQILGFARAAPIDAPPLDTTRSNAPPAPIDYTTQLDWSGDATGGVLPACASGCGTRSWRVDFGSTADQAAAFDGYQRDGRAVVAVQPIRAMIDRWSASWVRMFTPARDTRLGYLSSSQWIRN